eukprot:m.776560 g.776560  ORF g.776560 m.776560 type:complete len:887 (-) comp23263_c0_seq21:4131-6791(-)
MEPDEEQTAICPIEAWSVSEVSRFLLQHGLEMHVAEFRTHNINGTQLLQLDNDRMKEMGLYDMTIRGHLRKCIREYNPSTGSQLSEKSRGTLEQKNTSTQLDSTVNQLSDLFPDMNNDRVVAALTKSDNDIVKAIDALLLEDSQQQQRQQQQRQVNASTAPTHDIPSPRRRTMTNQTQVNAASDIYFGREDEKCVVDRSIFDTDSKTFGTTSRVETSKDTSTRCVGDRAHGSGQGYSTDQIPVDQTKPQSIPAASESIKNLDATEKRALSSLEARPEEVRDTPVELRSARLQTSPRPQTVRMSFFNQMIDMLDHASDRDEGIPAHASATPDGRSASVQTGTSTPEASHAHSPSAMTGQKAADGCDLDRSATVNADTAVISRSSDDFARANVKNAHVSTSTSRPRGDTGATAQRATDIRCTPDNNAKLHEAILELAASEEVYLADVYALQILLLSPLRKRASAKGVVVDPEVSKSQVRTMHTCVEELQRMGKEMLAEQRAIHTRGNSAVKAIAQVMLKCAPELKAVFMQYCTTCFTLQQCFDRNTPEFAAILERSGKDPLCRGLPISAFVLAPIQRLARYPLLLQAIEKRCTSGTGESVLIRKAQSTFVDITSTCNARLRSLSNHALVKEIEHELDMSRVDVVIPLSRYGGTGPRRVFVKRDTLELVSVSDRGKVTKAKPIEFILFTDMLIYGKPLRTLKPGDPTVEVFRQVHLGFLETKALDVSKFAKSKSIKSRDASLKKKTREGSSTTKGKGGGLDAMFTVMVFYDEDKAEQLTVRCASSTDAKRWVDALNPGAEMRSSWNYERARVVQDHDSDQQDELVLRVGDIINITETGDNDWYRGTRVQEEKHTKRRQHGWFQGCMVERLPSLQTTALMRKGHVEPAVP